MRRVTCVVALTGVQIDVNVAPPSSTGRATVDSLLRQLPMLEANQAPPFRVDVVTSGSAAYGPPRGLAPDDDLPEHDDAEAQLFLIFGPKYLERFPAPRLDSAEALAQHHARQVIAYKCLLSPFQQHLDASEGDHQRAVQCAGRLKEEFERLAAALPASIEQLNNIHLVNDSSATLGSRIGDFDPLVESGRVELTVGADTLRGMAERFGTLRRALDDGLAARPAAASAPSQAHYDTMRQEIANRLDSLKRHLKATERLRLEVAKVMQAVKAVRDGVMLKMSMVQVLPEAYEAAIGLARRRLTFNRAAQRLRQMLAVEHAAICDEIGAFVRQYGARFPTNIIPNIQTKPLLPAFEDPVADFLRASVMDFDEDPASELLVRLGLLRRHQHHGGLISGRQHASTGSMATTMDEGEASSSMMPPNSPGANTGATSSPHQPQGLEPTAAAAANAVSAAQQQQIAALEVTVAELRLALESAVQDAQERRVTIDELQASVAALTTTVAEQAVSIRDHERAAAEAIANSDAADGKLADMRQQLHALEAHAAAAAADAERRIDASARRASVAEAELAEARQEVLRLQQALFNATAAETTKTSSASASAAPTEAAGSATDRAPQRQQLATAASTRSLGRSDTDTLHEPDETRRPATDRDDVASAAVPTPSADAAESSPSAAAQTRRRGEPEGPATLAEAANSATAASSEARAVTTNTTNNPSSEVAATAVPAASSLTPAASAASLTDSVTELRVTVPKVDLPALRQLFKDERGKLDEFGLFSKVFSELALRERPIKFRETTGQRHGGNTTSLVAMRAGHTIRADSCGGAQKALEQARRDGFIFGELVEITAIEDDGTIRGPVMFQFRAASEPASSAAGAH